MIVLGIDPGLEGAIAGLCDEPFIIDLPTKYDEATGNRIDGVELARRLRARLPGGMPILVCIEALAAGGATEKRGNQFKTVGSQFWTQAAIVTTFELLGLEVQRHVAPVTWKAFYGVAGKRDTDAATTKRRVRELVAQLYPPLADHVQMQKHHNRAEAVLIAHWYRKTCT